jgi:hypothetical protein
MAGGWSVIFCGLVEEEIGSGPVNGFWKSTFTVVEDCLPRITFISVGLRDWCGRRMSKAER